MSHFMNETEHYQSKLILNPKYVEISPHNIQRVPSIYKFYNFDHHRSQSQQQALLDLFTKLSSKQLEKLKRSNQVQMVKQFQRVKRNMKITAKKNDSSVLKFFQKENEHVDLGKLIRNSCSKVDLNKKYFSKISIKVHTYREAQTIEQDKSNYQKWMNKYHNSATSSPNFNQMVYVLDKVRNSHKSNLQQKIKNSIQIPTIKHIHPQTRSMNNTFYNPCISIKRSKNKNNALSKIKTNNNYSRRINKGWNSKKLQPYLLS